MTISIIVDNMVYTWCGWTHVFWIENRSKGIFRIEREKY